MSVTTVTRMEGTPAYLPLECLTRQHHPSTTSDAWSLGCLTLFCLAGRPRYYGEDVEDIIKQINNDFPTSKYATLESKSISLEFSEDSKESLKVHFSSDHVLARNSDGLCEYGWESLESLTVSDSTHVRARDFIRQLLTIGKRVDKLLYASQVNINYHRSKSSDVRQVSLVS